MKKFRSFIVLLIGLFLFNGCDPGTSPNNSDEITASEERQFIWNGLNFWYFWQESVQNLADDRKNDIPSFNQLLNQPPTERALFDKLLYKQEDDFSWFIDDYEEHEAAQVGTSKSFGFRFGLGQEIGSNNVFGFVQYVVEDSPAGRSGLKRGDIFRGINGQNLTVTNFPELLNNDQYELRMADVQRVDTENGSGYRILNKDETVQVAAEVFTENPIHTYHIYDIGSRRVGYLLYNSFRFNFHEQLNNVFGEFKDRGIDELVLDLRYNGGGSLLTSALLASMISGVSAGSTFAELRYNRKRSSNNVEFPFFEDVPIFNDSGEREMDRDEVLNSLGLSRVYVLTSQRTASASETVINGLRPYGVEVVIVGSKTVGKDEGSITVYDAPGAMYSPRNPAQRSLINPKHPRAMQPIVFKIFNEAGEDYPDGFAPAPGPTNEDEFRHLEGGLLPLGDPDEPLFRAALNHMSGTVAAKELEITQTDLSGYIMDSSEFQPFHNDVFLLPSDLDRFLPDIE